MFKKNATIATLAILAGVASCQHPANQTEDMTQQRNYEAYPIYEGSDLGLAYSPIKSVLKVWSPDAQAIRWRLYESGEGGQAIQTLDMELQEQGVWTKEARGDQQGMFYTIQVKDSGGWGLEVPDPYAKAVGVNGNRAGIIDLATTNPGGWEQDASPSLKSPGDVIIYELHLRDASMHPLSGIEHKGKFLGLAERGAKTPSGVPTGLDHIKSMGVTHVHLLPIFDFEAIDERKLDNNVFNWGYAPKNFNALEGSFATDPYSPATRIKEFKQLVQQMHKAGLRVVMDVAYNHTFDGGDSPLNQTAAGYYYRHTADGKWSNASACGNETASERPMMRSYMLNSLKHWVQEYHIDGFRFDLMGIHDLETMNQISQELHRIKPDIFLYGEGWTAGPSPLPIDKQALKQNAYLLDRIAVFSDDIRDGIKGSWHDVQEKGFATGSESESQRERVKYGIVGNVSHSQIDFSKIEGLEKAWGSSPTQAINYVACHDNHTLWDRILESNREDTEEIRTKMHLLSNTIVFTSQGVPFLHAGAEFLRTKQGVENSFDSPDSINQLDWARKEANLEIVAFYQKLIQLRQRHPAFKMPTAQMIQENLAFEETSSPHLIAYSIAAHANGDEWGEIRVFFNGGPKATQGILPSGKWKVVLEGQKIDEKGVREAQAEHISIAPYTAIVAVQQQ